MAGTSLLALIDDIATILDDVAVLTKVATKKAAGVLGDDLALNAEQVHGVDPDRELPVVWAVAKGSAINKVILVPVALAISYFAPWGVTPLLMLGGLYLCYEGVEKLAHAYLHSPADEKAEHDELLKALTDQTVDLVAFEQDKIKGAVRTDFVLSAEIIVITLGTVATVSFVTQVSVLVSIATLMTVGVYGLVAAIVKLDDLGLHLTLQRGRLQRVVGAGILKAAPYLMRGLSIAGTAAMFVVGGGILTHGFAVVGHGIESLAEKAGTVPGVGAIFSGLIPSLLNGLVGALAGAFALGLVMGGKRVVAQVRGNLRGKLRGKPRGP